MTRPKIAPDRLRFEPARAQLGLARWQFRLLVEAGTLTPAPDGSFAVSDIVALTGDRTRIHETLHAEERLVSTQIARMIGTSPARIREAARDGIFTHVEEEQWRYGVVLRYRRADVEAALPAFDAWMRARRARPRVFDPVKSARRRAQRGSAQSSRQAIITELYDALDAIALLPVAEQPLARTALWLERLSGYRASLSQRRAQHLSTSRALRLLTDPITTRLDAPLFDAAEALTMVAPLPGLEVSLSQDGRVIHCRSCRDLSYGRGAVMAPIGCAACTIDTEVLRLDLLISQGGTTVFHETLPLRVAADWSRHGPDVTVTQPSVALMEEARAGLVPGRAAERPPTIVSRDWYAMNRAEQMAASDAQRTTTYAARLAGACPTETISARLAHLPRHGIGWNAPRMPHRDVATRRHRQVIPEAMIVERLSEAIYELTMGRVLLRQAA